MPPKLTPEQSACDARARNAAQELDVAISEAITQSEGLKAEAAGTTKSKADAAERIYDMLGTIRLILEQHFSV